MAEAMRAESLKKTPHAMISRAVAGIRKQTLIVNLPGSPKAVRENLAVILPALPHAIEKIKGDPRRLRKQVNSSTRPGDMIALSSLHPISVRSLCRRP